VCRTTLSIAKDRMVVKEKHIVRVLKNKWIN